MSFQLVNLSTNCLVWAVKLTENDIFNKYGYSGTGFGVHSPFTLSIGKWVKNAVFFWRSQ